MVAFGMREETNAKGREKPLYAGSIQLLFSSAFLGYVGSEFLTP
jgi:hypothetical protein